MALKKDMKHPDLLTLYQESESVDQDIFSEQRTNVLLVAGEHYARKGNRNLWNKIRTSKNIDDEQKIRLTKNHIYKVARTCATTLLALCPDVTPKPANDSDLSDYKAAELHKKVMDYYRRKMDYKAKRRKWVQSFFNVGELCVKVFFDPTRGRKVGYAPTVDEEGAQLVTPDGQPIPDETKPVYSGEFVIEEIYGFNLLRDPGVKQMEDSSYHIIRKMVKVSHMKEFYKGDAKKQKMFETSDDKTYMVFDSTRMNYGFSKDECNFMELYIRPCPSYPEGYFYFFTDLGIVEEGELPAGVYPLVFEACDDIQNHARGRSPIKQLRPFQIEINRAASKMAEHQMTLGDDKIIMQNGTTMQQGQTLPGIRGVVVNGAAPTILEGRSGAQYRDYGNDTVAEMYSIAPAEEPKDENLNQLDPYSLLYRAASQKRKFGLYIEKFEHFQINFWTTFLDLARYYMTDEELIEAVGRTEGVNIPEFRNQSKLAYILTLEPQSEDMETKLGRQITMTQVLQYSGGKLEKEDIGKFIRQMPFANVEESFDDFTIDYDAATNMILALDRGEQPMPHKFDDPIYMSKRLVARMRKADFKLLNPQIQGMYEQYKQNYDAMAARQQQELQAAQAGFIPTGGGLVGVDVYLPNENKRAKLPYEAINWLVQKLQTQGTTQERLNELETQQQIDISKMAQAQGGPGPMQPGGQPMTGPTPPQQPFAG